jgi:G:T/U-mismatch repair DNA glycosylase
MKIKHRFTHHKINPETEILIVGTFNPDTEKNPADFFYGRSRNHLWQLLPSAFNLPTLKGKSKEEKSSFMRQMKIDFADIVGEIEVDEGSETNYKDEYIDNKITVTHDIIKQIQILKKLKKVCFTRKTFGSIPNIKKEIKKVEDYCKENRIFFQYIITPARIYDKNKQEEWTNFLKGNTG